MAKLDHAKRVIRYELLGLFSLVLGLVTLGDLGAVGQALDDLCVMLAGNWHFLIPLYVLWVAVITMMKRNRFRYTSGQIGLLLICFVILVWSEMDLYSQAVDAYPGMNPDLLGITGTGIKTLSESLHELVLLKGSALPPASAGGGMIGYALFIGLKYLFSVTGTLLILVVVSLSAFVLITRKSLVGIIERGSKYFEQRFERTWSFTLRGLARALVAGTGARGRKPVRARLTRQVASDEDLESDAWEESPPPSVKAEKKQRKRKTKHLVEAELDGQGDEEQTLQPTAFPFPDFGVPYAEAPPFEDFLQSTAHDVEGHDEVDADMHDDWPPLYEHEEPAVLVDVENSRMTVKLPQAPEKPLRDDVPVVGAQPDVTSALTIDAGAATPVEKPYRLPDPRLLDRGSGRRGDQAASERDLRANAKKLQETFESFGVQVKMLEPSRGPTVTRYEIQPAVGVKVSRIVSLYDDLALALAAKDIRIEAPIPGKSAIGIEVPNKEISVVTFREVLETETFTHAKSLLSFALGKDIGGNTVVGDLAKMPHVLVAGATGSGKSVCINGIIASILFRAKPDEVKFIMIDPKMVELGVYNGIPHLFAPVVTDARRAAAALRKVIAEMEHRYELFSGAKVRDLERYNAYAERVGKRRLPLIVVIIDELADLMMVAPGDVEEAICRLAQMARASGIHLVVATQRPSVDVITGLIKANIPSRIAFSVSSGVDSRTILDAVGAEKLLGRGDMLYQPVGASKPVRLQGAFLSEPEVEKLVDFVRRQQEAEYVDDFSALIDEKAAVADDLDPLFEEAVRLVVEAEQASVSYLQRRLQVGYARAARLVDMLEQMGIVGPYNNSKPREVRMTMDQWLERRASSE